MIAGIVINARCAPDFRLYPLSVKALADLARNRAFLAELILAPDESAIRHLGTVHYLSDSSHSSEPVIGKLNALGCGVHRSKSLLGIPLVGHHRPGSRGNSGQLVKSIVIRGIRTGVDLFSHPIADGVVTIAEGVEHSPSL